MTLQDERIETAFEDELLRMKHEGVSKLLALPLDVLLWQVYRRGYIRGHSARSREVQQQEEQDRREGKYPMQVEIKYDADKLIIDGRDRTPTKGSGFQVPGSGGSGSSSQNPEPSSQNRSRSES